MEKHKVALITGINGQDGSFLAELLLSKGYRVHGVVRRGVKGDDVKLANISSILDQICLHEANLDESKCLVEIFKTVLPDECYHLSASSFVSYSFDGELSVMESNFNPTYHLLTSIKNFKKSCKFFFAGSAEMFGDAIECPQSETSVFNPKTMYGISKLSAYHLVRNYRERESFFACTGILYNHESARRHTRFVTRKIICSAIDIAQGLETELKLGNLDSKRDWGYAPDYVDAMYLMLQNETPTDYVISTGKLHSVRQFVEAAFSELGLDYRDYVKTDPKFYREPEKVDLCGDNRKIGRDLGWYPKKSLDETIKEMINLELKNRENNCGK
ncbi:GDP-mannose 4,6 dehydratase [Vibrio coralliilyticus]|mgnify:CR=1 FL=1|uniref:GDP-mannose 4,6-dehydratase n=1 Tax=Vibrio coralliilyticus TaxID=190893 RepID=UPI0002E66ECA|nr:GDP-mannose 4,6-dehydratase [Vibrio coralliilyticus]ERB62493.1 hypothetical protein N779_25980 [Vibrio coralliilyticus OCN008]PAU37294.1 GDP-mannose 4,6 dehydratase [Vibrio coralliilyticus]QIJ83390.1 GDP-mannose 4,6-dehydratase [Vibrio coralliilyticus OCN008]